MLDDRSYMRREARPYWSMTTILLVTLGVCFVVQSVLEQSSFLGWRVYDLFALSRRGMLEGRFYQLLTFQFMHSGIWHLLGNGIGLYFFGRAMEDTLGRSGLLKLYLLSGTVGGLLQIALAFLMPRFFDHTVLGASAGVFGLIAAFATRNPDQPITLLIFFVLPVTFPAKFLLIFEACFALGGIFLGFAPGTAHAAHLGGMLTGILFIRMLGWSDNDSEWSPFARRRQARELVNVSPKRASRRPKRNDEELPAAEFISREVDPILEKISAQGIHSLTDRERQILEAARSKMAKR